MVGRGLGQPAEGDLLLEVGQLGRAARDGPGEQGLSSSGTIRGDPTTDRPRIDAQEIGHLPGGVSLQDALDGQQATVFEFLGRPFVSHAWEYTRGSSGRTLLS